MHREGPEVTMGGAAWGLGNGRAGEEGSTHVLPESPLHTPAQGSPGARHVPFHSPPSLCIPLSLPAPLSLPVPLSACLSVSATLCLSLSLCLSPPLSLHLSLGSAAVTRLPTS